MSDNFTLESQKKGVLAIRADNGDLRLTLIYRHHLAKPSDLVESGVPDATGAYILCEQTPDEGGQWRCYVGKSAEGGLPSRLSTHISTPKPQIANWTAAILLHKSGGPRLSQDAAASLEHFLYNLLIDKNGVMLVNEKPPTGDPQIQMSEYDKMKQACQTAVGLLPIIGVNVTSAAKTRRSLKPVEADKDTVSHPEPASPRIRKQVHNPEKIPDLISAGMLKVGDVLEPAGSKYQGQAKAVIHDAQGSIKLLELHGSSREHENLVYDSPSSATELVVAPSNHANGWSFWKVQSTGKTLKLVREEYKTS